MSHSKTQHSAPLLPPKIDAGAERDCKGVLVWLYRKSLGMILSKCFILCEISKLVEYNREMFMHAFVFTR